MAAYSASTYPGHQRTQKLTWGQATRVFIRNGRAEKRAFRRFLVMLRTCGIWAAPIAILDDFTVVGVLDNVSLVVLVPLFFVAAGYSLLRIAFIRRGSELL